MMVPAEALYAELVARHAEYVQLRARREATAGELAQVSRRLRELLAELEALWRRGTHRGAGGAGG
jgi:phage shock protein A